MRHFLIAVVLGLTVMTLFSGSARAQALLFCECQLNGPCGNDTPTGIFAGCFNSTGSKGFLGPNGGGVSVAADDLLLVAGNLPANEPAIYYMGGAPALQVFGDGLRCVGAGSVGLFRYPVGTTGPFGIAQLGPGLVAYTHANFTPAGQIMAGQTWYFQYWYRDANGPCGTSFNLTNGVQVTFSA